MLVRPATSFELDQNCCWPLRGTQLLFLPYNYNIPQILFSPCCSRTTTKGKFFYTPCFLYSRTPSGFFSGMLAVFEPGGLKYYTLFYHPIDLICIQEFNLNSSSPFRIPGFSALRSDCTHSQLGICSPNTMHASGGVIIFVRQGLAFSELSTYSVSSLDPYSDYVWVNISLNNFSFLSFLIFMLPLFAFL